MSARTRYRPWFGTRGERARRPTLAEDRHAAWLVANADEVWARTVHAAIEGWFEQGERMRQRLWAQWARITE